MKKITALAALLAIPAMAAPAGYFQVPGTETTLKLYGQIQFREAYGFNGNGMGDVSGVPAAIEFDADDNPVGPAVNHNEDWQQGNQWNGHARYYMGVTTTTPSEYGDIVTKVYGRFRHNDTVTNGQSVNFNLEQAFVQIGGLKIGTDWALFGYGAWEPNTLFGAVSDENGNWTNSRQINYMFSPMAGLELGFGLDADSSANSDGTSNGTHPNMTAVAAFTQDWGGVTLAVNRQYKKDWTKNGPKPSGSGISYFVSGGWNITPNDQLTAMVLVGGEGYGSGNDGFYPDNGDYEFYTSTAMNVCYTHTWNDKFSSAVTVGQTQWDNDDFQDASNMIRDDYTHTEFIVNTTWNITKTVSFGVEYQMTQMESDETSPWIDEDGVATDKNKLNMLRFKLRAMFF